MFDVFYLKVFLSSFVNYTCSIHSCCVINLSLCISNKSFVLDTPWLPFSVKICSKKNRIAHFSPGLDKLWYTLSVDTQLCSCLQFSHRLISCNKTSSALLFLFLLLLFFFYKRSEYYQYFCAHTYPVIFSDDFRAFLCYQCVYVFLHVQI